MDVEPYLFQLTLLIPQHISRNIRHVGGNSPVLLVNRLKPGQSHQAFCNTPFYLGTRLYL